MKTRLLGAGAPAVTAVGFGAMPLSTSGRPDEAQGVKVIHSALDAGMTLIDTADVYCLDDNDIGHNERLVAKALAAWSGDRDSILVATKGGLTRPGGRWETDGRPAHIRAACERSLKALRVDTIDLYQFHAPDPAVPFADSVGAFAELRQEGKLRWVGLSNVSVNEIETAQGIVEVAAVQNRFSPFFHELPHDGVIKYCTDNKIGYLAYSPVGGGRLNKKLPGHPVVGPIAEAHSASTHAVVLAWAVARAPNVIVIPGARTVEHVLDSAGAAELELSPEELQAIEEGEFSTA
ncbi:MAG: aldo/keto reductase [Gemmatimonadota bacterium]|nr:MAG: aldo/keto reductase [Gemmatimonadota bacterium]